MKRFPLLAALAIVVVVGPRRPLEARAGDPPPPPAPASPAGPLPPPSRPVVPAAPAVPAAPPPPPVVPAPVPVPTPPAAALPGPHLSIERKSHDFGIVKQNQDVTAKIKYRNVGTAAVHVTARGECSCAQATASRKTLEPGETGEIELTFHTYTFVGKMVKHVKVTSDDPDQSEVAIEVQADVSAGIVREPANFYFNEALVGASPTATVKLKYYEGRGRPFQIKDVVAKGSGVGDVYFDAQPFFEGPWKGYEVTLKFRNPPPIGMVSGEAAIHTDDPDYPAIKSLVGGNISGKVIIAQQVTSVGIPPEGKEVVLRIRCRGFDETIDLGNVTAKSRKGVVIAKAERDASDPKGWMIVITLPATTPAGEVDDVVDVTTGVPGAGHHEIKVGGTVTAKAPPSPGR